MLKKDLEKEVERLKKKLESKPYTFSGTGYIIVKNIGMYVSNDKEYEILIREV